MCVLNICSALYQFPWKLRWFELDAPGSIIVFLSDMKCNLFQSSNDWSTIDLCVVEPIKEIMKDQGLTRSIGMEALQQVWPVCIKFRQVKQPIWNNKHSNFLLPSRYTLKFIQTYLINIYDQFLSVYISVISDLFWFDSRSIQSADSPLQLNRVKWWLKMMPKIWLRNRIKFMTTRPANALPLHLKLNGNGREAVAE